MIPALVVEPQSDVGTQALIRMETAQKVYGDQNSSEDGNKSDLTRREREVLSLVCDGLSNREIAERLSISHITVRHHLSSIFHKLCVSSRLKLVIYAFRNGLNGHDAD